MIVSLILFNYDVSTGHTNIYLFSLLFTGYFPFISLNSSHNYEPHNVVKTIFPVKYPIFLRRISFDGRLALQNQLSPHNAWMRYPVYRRWYILPSLMKHQVNIVWNIVPLGSCQLYCTCRKKKQSEKETYLHLVFCVTWRGSRRKITLRIWLLNHI